MTDREMTEGQCAGVCTACGADETSSFFHVSEMPVHVGFIYDDARTAELADLAEVELLFCHRCGHVFNRVFDPSLIKYRPGYEVGLQHSPVFRAFMESVAQRLIDRFQLRDKTIFEIGAGNAWFLELICSRGGNQGYGVDPTIAKVETRVRERSTVHLIPGHFDASFAPQYAEIDPDFVCCLSVLEHIASPSRLVHDLRSMIAEREVPIYFEIFNAARAFERGEIWSIHYEQCNYFSLGSFSSLFERAGFRVRDCGGCYEGDQYLFVEAVADRRTELTSEFETPYHAMPDEVRSFAVKYAERKEFWGKRLMEFREAGKKTVFWGTGGKGVTFLNLLGTRGIIDYVAEINPAKHHKYIAGSAQQIVPPEFLAEYGPDVVIISNALYEQEIRQQAGELGLRCEFYVA